MSGYQLLTTNANIANSMNINRKKNVPKSCDMQAKNRK